MTKIKLIFKYIGYAIGIGILSIIAFYSFIGKVPQLNDLIYATGYNKQGGPETVIITPNKYIFFADSDASFREVYKLTKLRGVQKYFLGTYLVGEFPFGLRVYPNAKEVFTAKMTLKEANDDSSNQQIGESWDVRIIIYEDRISIGGNATLNIETLASEDRKDLENALKARYD